MIIWRFVIIGVLFILGVLFLTLGNAVGIPKILYAELYNEAILNLKYIDLMAIAFFIFGGILFLRCFSQR